MPRDREYESNADRQRAYRERKAAEDARLREELHRAQREAATAGATKATHRDKLRKKLVRVLGYLGSDSAGERDNAARLATQLLKEAGLTWYDVLDVTEEK
jgi:hypothetical protein